LNTYISMFKTINFSKVCRPFSSFLKEEDYLIGFVEFDMKLFRFTVQLEIKIKAKQNNILQVSKLRK
jgi:uncharacterized OB-fold protein